MQRKKKLENLKTHLLFFLNNLTKLEMETNLCNLTEWPLKIIEYIILTGET